MTALPWVAFTSLTHPMRQHPADSIPRFAFGKVFGDHSLRQMPLGVQGHHALMDGVHIGRFYTQFQEYLSFPDSVLG
jgi:chloramphenicol O-acetyltransferase type A